MSLETMAFVLGGLLIAAGVFGGGLEIKELKIPQIGGTARLVASVVGLAFVVLALAINQGWIEQRTKTFKEPMYDENFRLDYCAEWGNKQSCGQKAATTWCKKQGYLRAIEYPPEKVGKEGETTTKLIGDGRPCEKAFCTSFKKITCTKDAQ